MRKLAVMVSLAALAGVAPANGRAAQKRKIVGSCSFPRSCADYDAAADLARRRCEALGSRWSDRPCPTAKVVGTCTLGWGTGSCQTRFYPPVSREEAKRLCADSHGTFL